jgi:hypothetical protein
MADNLRAQRDFALRQLDDLMRRGRELRHALAANASDAAALSAARAWQHASAAAIHQLSGGSKAHWLSRAFSSALLIRSTEGGAIIEADVGEIVGRILDVLEQAGASLISIDDVAAASSTTQPAARRFEFVHSSQLRPILEVAFVDSGLALASGDFTRSLMTSCGILEAIITDALEHCGSRIADCGIDPSIQAAIRNPQSAMTSTLTFEARIAAAERAGLIRGGCARLPASARAYRDAAGVDGASGSVTALSERDAKIARQVLHVVMRDLDPGR